MKTLKISLLFLLFSTSVLFGQSAEQIMEKTNKVATESSYSTVQKMKLSTCKYAKEGKKMVCVEKARVKEIENVQKDTGPNKKDSKSVSIVLNPASEKGVGMLSFDYDAPDKDTDNWLYLSALGKVKRIVSSSDDDDTESGSFFGTEFSIEDMENPDLEDYTYKILSERNYRTRPAWIIESIPTASHARKTRYSKVVSWIDKERYIVLRTDLYNKHGRLKKRLTMSKIVQIDGIWVAKSMTMNNVSSHRVTKVSLSSIAFNREIPDNFLTQRTLTDFAFRERELAKLRAYIQ